MPLSWLLLEQLGWALIPQVQPMRALLYCHLFCQLLGAIAAWLELRESQWLRAFAWMVVPLSLAMRGDLLLVPVGEWWKQWTLLVSETALPDGVDPNQPGPRRVTANNSLSALMTMCAVRTFAAVGLANSPIGRLMEETS
jgi:hypothetical protein